MSAVMRTLRIRCENTAQGVPLTAFEIIKVGKMWVKRKMQKNTIITLYFNMLQSY